MTLQGFKSMVHRFLFPRSQDPFLDVDSLARQLELTTQDLRKQVARLERASSQNERATDKLIDVIENQKQKVERAVTITTEALREVKEQTAIERQEYKRRNGNGNGKHA